MSKTFKTRSGEEITPDLAIARLKAAYQISIGRMTGTIKQIPDFAMVNNLLKYAQDLADSGSWDLVPDLIENITGLYQRAGFFDEGVIGGTDELAPGFHTFTTMSCQDGFYPIVAATKEVCDRLDGDLSWWKP